MKVTLQGFVKETKPIESFKDVDGVHIEREGHPQMILTEYKGKLTILFGGKVLYTEESTRVKLSGTVDACGEAYNEAP